NQTPTARRGRRPPSEITPCELAASDLGQRSQVSQLARSQRTCGQRPSELAPCELAASDLAHRLQVSQLARSQRTRGQRLCEHAPSELTSW
ncbi:UNVERIFIED_CONTAM: hypothetical protein Sradi_2375100, partial [Sesamum radiatum]